MEGTTMDARVILLFCGYVTRRSSWTPTVVWPSSRGDMLNSFTVDSMHGRDLMAHAGHDQLSQIVNISCGISTTAVSMIITKWVSFLHDILQILLPWWTAAWQPTPATIRHTGSSIQCLGPRHCIMFHRRSPCPLQQCYKFCVLARGPQPPEICRKCRR